MYAKQQQQQQQKTKQKTNKKTPKTQKKRRVQCLGVVCDLATPLLSQKEISHELAKQNEHK